ncbi:restriction endonuclease [Tateyamaria sp. SN6-1]|uniref:restriction endonuclease n=1 Tax=Tateyamaria sp. SN6-1 TaxID=3092148 RepID=UPI0039F4F19C
MEKIYFDSTNIKNINAGVLRAKYSAAGDRILRYYIDVQHTVLDLHKELSAPEISILQNKVDTLMAQWDKQFEAHQKKQNNAAGKELAEEMTQEAENRREQIQQTLARTLSIDDAVDWSVLKDKSDFKPKPFARPRPVRQKHTDPEPKFRILFWQTLLGRRTQVERAHDAALAAHLRARQKIDEDNATALKSWEAAKADHAEAQKSAERAFVAARDVENAKVDALEASWREGVPEAIEEHASIVLEASQHDDVVPKRWEVRYEAASKMLLVLHQLPVPADLPTTKSVRFVASTGELKETDISERDKKALFDDLCYQLCLRTIHELFEADTQMHIDAIAFNGWTRQVDPAVGQEVEATILSVVAQREEFLGINLSRVEPKACFKSLKGVSAATLVGLTPVAPVIAFEKSDKRFIEGRAVDLQEDGTTNLAAMDWEDFEHLVRDIFEREFASRGGEVRVTQSSSDGGVDAVAFDPDPISGGKIIIPAKRYTRTVGVAAVRDLYGTTMNEGAIKGILVTTADYGPDAHKFASDKPLTLMSGAHLLHLLEKHGVEAKIDFKEARSTLGLTP